MTKPDPPSAEYFQFGRQRLDPQTVWEFARTAMQPDAHWQLEFATEALARMRSSADLVARMGEGDALIYGVNTGFGHFAERRIAPDQLRQLQINLIRSHACGVGEEVSRDIVLALWLLRLHTISRGFSGIRPETVDFIVRLLNAGILGCVPSRGSVGASGDLAPSAHAVSVLIGEGFCTRPLPAGNGFERVSAERVLGQLGLQAMSLAPKEGLVLINGTQYTTALALKAWYEAKQLLRVANLAAAMSMEATGGALSVLDDIVLQTHHPQTLTVGREIAAWLAGSSCAQRAKTERRFIQAPYCLRCAPQVHGAVKLAIDSGETTLEAEINAVSDNPLVFADANGGEVHSCGNFHGIYPARVSDDLASALTVLGSISERRINMIMDERLSGLPCFLTESGGVSSGMMMVHVTAAALAGECKLLCVPAGINSIPTNCDREDFVPMGPAAGLKALQVVGYVRQILAIELLVAAQALDLRQAAALPDRLAGIHGLIRREIPFLAEDRSLSSDIAALAKFIASESFNAELAEASGNISEFDG
ncbi:HAL/PAL/TAL family ammonia-lyase [Methylomonas sp. MgM2]